MSDGDTGGRRRRRAIRPADLDRLIARGDVRRGNEPISRQREVERALEGLDRRDRRALGTPAVDPKPLADVLAALDEPPELLRERRPNGTATRLRWRYPLAASHGGVRYGDALASAMDALPLVCRDDRLTGMSLRRTLFLDIESTGLSHGAGTFAFLIGLAWFEDDALVMEQLFLEDPADEAAQLSAFAELREQRPYLVSFNGRCFDVHVLHSRLVLNRIYDEPTTELKLTPHVDLLHLSRAIHGGRFEDTRLQTLERRLFGIQRVGDIPGELIPPRYFAFLQTSDAAPLAPVFTHNVLDVLTMVSLLRHVTDELGGTSESSGEPEVQANIGRLWLRRRCPHEAAEALDRALAGGPATGAPWRIQALRDAVTARKQQMRAVEDPTERDAIAARLEALLGDWLNAAPEDPDAHAELALFHERSTKDTSRALHHARQTLRFLPATSSAEERERAARKVERLERRLTRSVRSRSPASSRD